MNAFTDDDIGSLAAYDEKPTTLEQYALRHGAYFTAESLMATDFPAPKWAVHGLIPEGLTLLAGAPKLGKSWLALGLGITIAQGGDALDAISTTQGDVLYAALEDTPRRLQSRIAKMVEGPAPARLTITTALPEMPYAVDLIAGWLDDHPDARMVVVDVLGKIRPATGANTDRYENDYRVIGALKRLADAYSVAVVVVTHVRKMTDGDVFNTVSGSTGLTGAADTTVVLQRSRNESGGVLHITGRDVEESEYAVSFNPERGEWTLDGEALIDAAAKAAEIRSTVGLGVIASKVVQYVSDRPDGARAGEIATALSIPDTTVRQYLKRAKDDGRLEQPERGLYRAVTSVTSVTSDGYGTAQRDSRDTCDNPCLVCGQPIDPVAGTVHPLCGAA
ncbi:hypothetical protein CBR64_20460 [Cellulosimicrobium cellulans]|uniref:AAA family ATPase n=1 Tax=Cellulosimicrobium cellulans TaxID=1710 RepID=A0A1Y0HZL5_CELCE|nr:AAA family ATPase [Cellulosimicrobium cellulans]ARU53450.1 hypothetical protein CBR64_20460 [Cellulosimicrobium cellulans]